MTERIAANADIERVNPFWPEGNAPVSGLRGSRPETAAAPPHGAENGAPFLRQVEEMLGEDAEPDAAFFMDSWTVGVGAASQSFLQRRKESKNRAPEMSGGDTCTAYTPFFVVSIEAPVETLWPLSQGRRAMAPVGDERWLSGEEAEDERDSDNLETIWPLTHEAACRVLGVQHPGTHQEIRSAYRKMASQYHPDRVAGRGVHELKLASERMACINEAYRLLSAELVERENGCPAG